MHDPCFRSNTLAFRNIKQELKCLGCRLSWKSTINSSIIPGCNQDGLPVEDIDTIVSTVGEGGGVVQRMMACCSLCERELLIVGKNWRVRYLLVWFDVLRAM